MSGSAEHPRHDDALDDLPTKRAKTGGSHEDEIATLRASLHASREETKAAREEAKVARDGERAAQDELKAAREETSSALQREQTALGEIAALKEKFKAELRAERQAEERRPWLEKHGFDPDDPTKMATKTFVNGCDIEITPMIWACHLGDLEMCRNLFENGAANDTKTMAGNSSTPMAFACEEGHLSVCKWLYEVGAAADIRKAIQN